MGEPEAPDPDEPKPDEAHPASYPPTQEDEFPAATDGGGTRVLSRLLTRSPFLDLHKRAGNESAHPKREMLCFSLDLVVRIVAVVLILGIVIAVAWKTLAPLPDLSTPNR